MAKRNPSGPYLGALRIDFKQKNLKICTLSNIHGIVCYYFNSV